MGAHRCCDRKRNPPAHAGRWWGDVEMCGLGEDGTVSLAMVGACASCPSSTVTLRFMIRNLLLFRFPEEVTDVKGVFAEDDGRDFGL